MRNEEGNMKGGGGGTGCRLPALIGAVMRVGWERSRRRESTWMDASGASGWPRRFRDRDAFAQGRRCECRRRAERSQSPDGNASQDKRAATCKAEYILPPSFLAKVHT